MRNVTDKNLKTCIFKTVEEFENDLNNIFGDNYSIDFDSDGLSLFAPPEGVTMEEFENEDYDYENYDYDKYVLEPISNYYDVKVTSIHVDDFCPCGIWIVYKI